MSQNIYPSFSHKQTLMSSCKFASSLRISFIRSAVCSFFRPMIAAFCRKKDSFPTYEAKILLVLKKYCIS